ncbi:MAG: twin-arginine translocase subunit TatC [Thermoguttaceae bacterium]|jgi:sec-independent protein translocase protein TatC
MKFFKNDEDLFHQSTMSFGEHLEELRACLFKSLLGLVVGFIIGLFVGQWVVEFIQTPLEEALRGYYKERSVETLGQGLAERKANGENLSTTPEELAGLVEKENFLAEEVYVDPADLLQQLKTLHPKAFDGLPVSPKKEGATLSKKDLVPVFLWRPAATDPRLKSKAFSAYEPFSIYLKASFLVGAILSAPWIFWQVWSFVAAGLYTHERHYVRLYLPFSLLLFLAGVCLAFFFVFKPVLSFLFSFNHAMGIDPEPRISEWLSFVMFMPLGFGISFQLPLVMLFLERIGIFSVDSYWSKWKIAVLVIALLASVLTPSPDPWSMLLMGVPLVLLYFGGILLCNYMPRNRSPYAEAEV